MKENVKCLFLEFKRWVGTIFFVVNLLINTYYVRPYDKYSENPLFGKFLPFRQKFSVLKIPNPADKHAKQKILNFNKF